MYFTFNSSEKSCVKKEQAKKGTNSARRVSRLHQTITHQSNIKVHYGTLCRLSNTAVAPCTS